MKLIAVESSDLSLPDLAELAKKGPVILTRRGKPLAAVCNLSGSDWESVSLANDPRFVALIEEARESHRKNGGTSLETLGKELGLKAKKLPPPRKRKSTDNRARQGKQRA